MTQSVSKSKTSLFGPFGLVLMTGSLIGTVSRDALRGGTLSPWATAFCVIVSVVFSFAAGKRNLMGVGLASGGALLLAYGGFLPVYGGKVSIDMLNNFSLLSLSVPGTVIVECAHFS